MTLDLSLLTLIQQASLVVQFVMGLLICASMMTWMLIWVERQRLKRAFYNLTAFEKSFWSGIELSKLYNRLSAQREQLTYGEQVFLAGFKEFLRLRKQQIQAPQVLLAGVERAMKIQVARISTHLEERLPLLATIQSVSPFIGLFGTVWGVMHAFRGLGAVKHITLATVAPGIAEALIATAMGLVAAIPASVAYNRFSVRVHSFNTQLALFAEEFLNVLYRETHAKAKVAPTPPSEELSHAG